MAHTSNERERLLTEARAAHREAERERSRRESSPAESPASSTTRSRPPAQLDAERTEFEARVARFNATQAQFNAASAADRERQAAWTDLDARQKRLAAEWAEAAKYQAEQAAALDARAREVAARENAEAEAKAKLQSAVAALHKEAASLTRGRGTPGSWSRNSNSAGPNFRPKPSPRRSRRSRRWKGFRSTSPRTATSRGWPRSWSSASGGSTSNGPRFRGCSRAFRPTRRRSRTAGVLAEQFAQLAEARAVAGGRGGPRSPRWNSWRGTLRRREAELDAREARLARADSAAAPTRTTCGNSGCGWRRGSRSSWPTRCGGTPSASRSKPTSTGDGGRDRARSALALSPDDPDAIPFALAMPEESVSPTVTTELTALRDELERMATVLLEAELPEPPDSELPWGPKTRPPCSASRAIPTCCCSTRSARAA